MDFYPITLQDKKLFDKFLAGRHHDLITYNFTNLFLWRQWCRFSWQIINDTLCINSDYNNQNMMLVPISPNDTLVLQTTEILMDYYRHTQTPFILTEVSQTMLDLYEHHWPGRFQAIAHRDEANYIYNRQDLAQLIGKRYNSKRNHVNRFEREYPNYQFVPLTKDLIPRCKERQTFWRLSHGATDIELILEEQGVLDALNHFEELGCSGACLLLDDVVEAFTIGDQLNEDTWAVHIEKGNTEINGSFQAINQFFVRDYCADAVFINRAEDTGNEGLRRSKLSYHPCRLEPKYMLQLK